MSWRARQGGQRAPDKRDARTPPSDTLSRRVADGFGWGPEVNGGGEDSGSAHIEAHHICNVCRCRAAGVDYLLHCSHGGRACGRGEDGTMDGETVGVSKDERLHKDTDEKDASGGFGGLAEVDVGDTSLH